MKNLMIYINPSKCFGNEEAISIKIQIDNSLDLGWKREDIMLVTNFPYEYNDIKAIEVSGENYAPFFPPASKISTIIDISEKGFIEKGRLYWFHDIDVFQNEVITEYELELDGIDIGLCDKGRRPRWGTGSIFFKESATDIFRMIKQVAYKYKINEEPAFNAITSNNILWASEAKPEATMGNRIVPANIPGAENINHRVKKMNISYNFAGWNIRSCYEMAVKPIRVVHFHPCDADTIYEGASALDYFLHGKNSINKVLVPERLIKIFNKHGIK
jgi:hypothetical protein